MTTDSYSGPAGVDALLLTACERLITSGLDNVRLAAVFRLLEAAALSGRSVELPGGRDAESVAHWLRQGLGVTSFDDPDSRISIASIVVGGALSEEDEDLSRYEHPGWCHRQLCGFDTGGSLVHREPGRIEVLTNDVTVVAFRERSDEVYSGGIHVIYPTDYFFQVNSSEAVLMEDLSDVSMWAENASVLLDDPEDGARVARLLMSMQARDGAA